MADSASRHAVLPFLLGVCLVVALAFVVRALGLEFVFVGDEVVFPPADPQYHLRRALFTFSSFPRVLLLDPYINYPGGAPVPWPPGFDWTLGAVARALADDVHGFEIVVAWVSPVIGALTVIPIVLAGSLVGGRRVGVVAGFFYALLPIAAKYGRVGNADHHAAVAMIGAWLLVVCLASVRAAARDEALGRIALFHTALRFTLLLTWHGSLLYLAVSEGLLLLVGVALGRRSMLGAQALGALCTATLILPVLAFSPTPLGGDYSSIALSRLHVLAMVGVAGMSGGLYGLQRKRPGDAVGVRVLQAAGLAIVWLTLLMVLPELREGLEPALRFLTLRDEVGALTGEQGPLFAWLGRGAGRPAIYVWGYFAYAIPLAPAAAWLAWQRRDADLGLRAAAALLAAWGAFFASLALVQRRYGNDFAPAASILFALALSGVATRVTRRWADRQAFRFGSTLLALALCALLFLPAIRSVHGPRLRATFHHIRSPQIERRDVQESVALTLARFVREVGRVTPETSAYLAPGPPPEYGVIAHANLGHALQYGARRATATDPFWWYIGRENWDRSLAFFETPDEAEAIRLAAELRGRYVVTTTQSIPGSVAAHLHNHDGVALRGRAPLTSFRHVTETSAAGSALGEIFRPGVGLGVPYKLFEVVKGAPIEVRTGAGQRAVAAITLDTPTGRKIVYQQEARADETGTAWLRLPYWTRPASASAPVTTRARGRWRIRVAGEDHPLAVDEEAVRTGRTLVLDVRGDI